MKNILQRGKLSKRDVAALRWAINKADEWYGFAMSLVTRNVTGERALEEAHKRNIKAARDALKRASQ